MLQIRGSRVQRLKAFFVCQRVKEAVTKGQVAAAPTITTTTTTTAVQDINNDCFKLLNS